MRNLFEAIRIAVILGIRKREERLSGESIISGETSRGQAIQRGRSRDRGDDSGLGLAGRQP